MSLTNALGTAKSGLMTNAIQTDTTARNISNANTEGYTRKSAELVTIPAGGVYVAKIDRQVDTMLSKLDRTNVSRLSADQTIADGMKAYTDYLGQPTDEMSPVTMMANLKDSLITLSLGVSETSSQMSVVTAARGMAENLNSLSTTLKSVGTEVEMNIRYDVADLNTALDGIADLNRRIVGEKEGTTAMVDLQDQMDDLLQKVSEIVDIQTVTDKSGMVNVTTGGGVELVNGRFVQDVTYDSASGQITAGDVNMTPSSGNRSFSGGSLFGLFQLKNSVLPEWSADLDTMAAALVEGFERVAPVDGTRGLFTDDGNPYDPADISGLASRIMVNPAVDHEAGGDPSLIQSGGDPTAPVGDPSVVDSMLALFEEKVMIPGRPFGDSPSLTKMSASIVSAHQQARSQADSAVSRSTTAAATISASRENFQGVDVDTELQNLLVLEKSYAANAKVLTTVTQMMDALLQAV